MPVSVNFSSSTNYTIPDKVFSMRVRMWGAGGGGEFVDTNIVSTTDGGNGGNTSWIGMTARGGQGGGVSGRKNSLGSGGGTNTNEYPDAETSDGNNGGLFAGGTGIGGRGAGGNGTTGFATYTSSSTHIFNNDSNEHVFLSTSDDISLNYMNKDAENGIFGTAPLDGKYYQLTFNIPYINNSWTFEVFDICQNAAGGGDAVPYSLNGTRNKDNTGIDLWFQNTNGANTYIRCFSFNSTGLKRGAQGRGGGSGGYIDVTVSRQSLIDKGFSPGATYSLTVGGGGSAGGTTALAGSDGYVSLFMYIIPTITLTTNKTSLVSGECATLTWDTTGDADLITWTTGNIDNENLSSNTEVCPLETTTYTAVASGRGGSSDSASVTIVVYQKPTASISTPESLDYGVQGLISYETQYADISIVITPFYTYRNNNTGDNFVEAGDSIDITPVAGSAELGGLNTIVSDDALSTSIPYNESGPFSVQYILVATGNGGAVSVDSTTQIIIDDTPDNLILEETVDVFKEQDPVFTPQTEVLSDMYLIDGIDIPVEIKSSSPIQVDINNEDNWFDLREI